MAVDQFTEIAYISIADTSEEVQFGTITTSFEMNLGAKDIEQVVTVAGGRMVKFVPQEMAEISMEIEPVGMSCSSSVPNGLLSWYLGGAYNDTVGLVTRTRKKFRVTVLWTDQTSAGASNAAGLITAGNSFRLSFWGCYMTEQPLDSTDGSPKTKVTFKCPPFNKAGSGMIKVEEDVGAATLVALGAYTGSNPSL